jgi:hypothetical protein
MTNQTIQSEVDSSAKKVSKKELLSILKDVHFDTLGKNKQGEWVIRNEYFYRHGHSSDQMFQKTEQALKQSGILFEMREHGDHWAAFRGGSSTAQSSHFWVTFITK